MIRHGKARKVLRDFTNEEFNVASVTCKNCGEVSVLTNPFGPRVVDECERCKAEVDTESPFVENPPKP
jgi:transposase